MTEVRRGLYLGNHADSRDMQTILLRRIGLVLNVTEEWPRFSGFARGIREIKYNVKDDLERSSLLLMQSFLPHAVDAIDRSLHNGVPVLVHCHAGVQRSACVVAAYLMYSEGLSVADAVYEVRKKRPIAFFPRVNFLESLEAFGKR